MPLILAGVIGFILRPVERGRCCCEIAVAETLVSKEFAGEIISIVGKTSIAIAYFTLVRKVMLHIIIRIDSKAFGIFMAKASMTDTNHHRGDSTKQVVYIAMIERRSTLGADYRYP
ncbi:hypothetical protein BKA69DRAFT_324973 [Paraphysoderma sedebokerense]|nr:hypothetical protein BKA69DRAFT_324973 [Paraphysoderma sedebokerense]